MSGTKTHADQRQPRGHNARLKVLKKCARLFAVVSTVLVGLSIFCGSWAPMWISVVAPPVVLCALWLVNGSTVERMHRKVRPLRIPWQRLVIGVATAFFVAFSVTFWWFGGEIEEARGARAVAGWDQDSDRLREELVREREIANREVRPVDQDPEVVRLTNRLADLRTELKEAADNELCELDGRCGTREQGMGDAYYAKKDRRLRIEEDITRVEAGIGIARTSAQERFTGLNRERDGAKKNVGELDDQLDELGPRPEIRNRFSALSSIDARNRVGLAGLWFGALGAYFAVDVLAFQWAVRRACRRRDQRGSRFKKLIDEQAERPERNGTSAKGAISAAEYLRANPRAERGE